MFWQDGKICSSDSKQPLATNFGKGGMKKFFEDTHVKSAPAYGQWLEKKPSKEFWSYAMQSAEKGKIPQSTLHETGDTIRAMTG